MLTVDQEYSLAYLDYIKQNQVEISPTASVQLTQILDGVASPVEIG